MEQLVDITAVEVVSEHRLRLTFEDGTVGDVDFLPQPRRASVQRSLTVEFLAGRREI